MRDKELIYNYLSAEEFEQLKRDYNEVNNSFQKTVIYRVGESQGFHSEVDSMMQVMLYCYYFKIKFVLYGDGANFASGHGWNEFFESFCEENHSKRNMHVNRRHKINWKHPFWRLDAFIFKILNKADYLTQDVFFPCINDHKKINDKIKWELFDINSMSDFAHLSKLALRYNKQTKEEIETIIKSLELPEEYFSVQIRGGDKSIEYKNLMSCQDVIKGVKNQGIEIKNLFIFTDDFQFIEEMKILKPEWNIFTLTKENERGYVNAEFQKMEWKEKRLRTIKMFAMIEICLLSKIHLGCGQSCIDSYIKSLKKDMGGYIEVFNDREPAKEWIIY